MPFPGFDGHRDTPVESLHVLLLGIIKYLYRDAINSLSAKQEVEVTGRWASFKTEGLKTAPVRPSTMVQFANSLVGKEFRLALQACTFVLYPYLSEERKDLWSLLGHLGSYAFQTTIIDKQKYVAELRVVIDRVVHKLIGISGQWTNKPKFHHLLHLPDSIDLFGPATLFATEKFESYNAVLRAASVHSNRQAPGRDIGNTFLNYRLLRILLSGTTFWDTHLRGQARSGSLIRETFNSNRFIKQGMGYDEESKSVENQTSGFKSMY